MVEVIAHYGVRDTAVLRALGVVPRHEFVPPAIRSLAYGDHPLPVGHGQTISQPYIVAFMSEVLESTGSASVSSPMCLSPTSSSSLPI